MYNRFMDSTLKIEVKPTDEENKFQIIAFFGEFDKAGYNEVRDELNKSVEGFSAKSLVFDFTELRFINSEGIGYLMEVHTHLIQQDKKLVVVGLNAHVKDVFSAIGMKEIVPSFETEEEFLKSL